MEGKSSGPDNSVELRHSPFLLVFTFVMFAGAAIYLGFDGYRYVMTSGSRGTNIVLVVLFESFSVPFLIFFGRWLLKADFSEPALVITPEGLRFRRFAPEFIPWSSVREVHIQRASFETSQFIRLELRDDADLGSYAKIAENRWLESGRSIRAISIMPHTFDGMSSKEVIALIKHYYRLYGLPVTAEPIDDAATAERTYSSSSWTGLE